MLFKFKRKGPWRGRIIYPLTALFFLAGIILGARQFAMSGAFEEMAEVSALGGDYAVGEVIRQSFLKGSETLIFLLMAGLSLLGVPVAEGLVFYKGYSLGISVFALISAVDAGDRLMLVLKLLPWASFRILAFIFLGTAMVRSSILLMKGAFSGGFKPLDAAVSFLIAEGLMALSAVAEGLFMRL